MRRRSSLALLPLLLLTALAVAEEPAAAPVAAAAGGGDAADAGDADAAPEAPRVEWLHELDVYYSSLDLSVPLTAEPVPDGGRMRERDVYRRLFLDSLHPRVLLLEASVYPLPALGTWLRNNEPGLYDDFQVGEAGNNQLNLIEGLTAGFQEPWALSAFVGSEMRFSHGGRHSTNNRGYMGYLVSCGAKHIRQNVLIDDNWCEAEWKLKGEREVNDEILSWSFRVGVKEHGNPDVADVAYLGVNRDNLHFGHGMFWFLQNSRMELLAEFDQATLKPLRWESVFGKKLPIRRWRGALALDVGFIVEDGDKYTGALYDPTVDRFTIVFRPNIEF